MQIIKIRILKFLKNKKINNKNKKMNDFIENISFNIIYIYNIY